MRLLPSARLGGPMPWVIAIMIALTVVAAAAALSLRNVGAHARDDIAGALTVQVVEAAPAARERQAAAAMALLRRQPDVADLRRVPDAELARLLEPWLGQLASNAAGDAADEQVLPIPALIDLRLTSGIGEDRVARLRADLRDVAPAARVDAQAQWLGPVFGAITALQLMAVALIVLLAGTGAAAVWLAARTALGANRETIEVVHLLGGTDGQIARLFQNSIAVDAAIGGGAGLLLGILAIVMLARQFARLDSGMMAGGGLMTADWIVLAAIPLAGIIIAMITARVTVLAALRRML